MSKVDLNVENYTFDELLRILRIDEPTVPNIEQTVRDLKQKYSNDPQMTTFFDQVFEKLMRNIGTINQRDITNPYHEQYKDDDDQIEEWMSEQNLIQDDNIQNSKTTSRRQKVGIFDSPHNVMKREKLGVNQDYDVPIAQGDINPRLENIITKTTNIDSKYRKNIITDVSFSTIDRHHLSIYSSTDFVLELNEPLTNVLSLKLYSVHLPFTWYNVDEKIGTDRFTFIPTVGPQETIILLSGNYTSTEFIADLIQGSLTGATYNTKSGKITLTFNQAGTVVFFSEKDDFCEKNMFQNNNLGWNLGFRDTSYAISGPGVSITADVPLVAKRTNYLLLSIDDFNSNYVVKNLNGIKNIDLPLDLPTYSVNDISGTFMLNSDNCSAITSSTGVQPVLGQGFPRQITQAQQYTFNEILKSRKSRTTAKSFGPMVSNLFAVVPVKTDGLSTGDQIVEFSGGIQSNMRTYFGPVNIKRLHIRLYDDGGNILNLNGGDWSFVLASEHLYQY